MIIFLNEINCKENLYPISLTRNVADIRIGILTIREKWEILINDKSKITTLEPTHTDFISIDSNIIPTKENFEYIINNAKENNINFSKIKVFQYPWQIVEYNDWAIRADFELLSSQDNGIQLNETNSCVNSKYIFIEPGANINYSIINAETGPVFISKNATIMEGCLIRGPFFLGENSVLKMGSKIYGATSIGSNCVVGGEIKNSILLDNSNKAHDGYLGDSLIGSWCNLGAGTSNSNVKNSGNDIFYEDKLNQSKINAGFKAGVIMGDYSRCAINTSFNSGTIVGVSCNIFSNQLTEKYIESFSWGNEQYVLDKAIKHIGNWKKMKNSVFSNDEIETLKNIFNKKYKI